MQLTLRTGNAREVMTSCRQFSDWLYEIVARFCSHGITKFLLTGTFTVVSIVLWKIQCTLLPGVIMLAMIIWGIKNALYLSVNVCITKVLIRDSDNIFTYPTGDEAAFLRDHSSHAKVQPFAGQRQYLHFSVILSPWVLIWPREPNPRHPALQSSALPTELILPRYVIVI